MSHPFASQSSSTPLYSSYSPVPQRLSRRVQYQAAAKQGRTTQPSVANFSADQVSAANPQRSSPRPRLSKRNSRNVGRAQQGLSAHRRNVLWAGGAITLLAMATILPTQVSSQGMADSSCQQVIKSGAEISRGQLSSLLAVPIRSTRAAVRQVVAEPYCTLPNMAPADSTEISTDTDLKAAAQTAAPKTIEREAYPLAFDPEAWVVLNYSSGEYQGYDFVFKP